MNVQPRSVVGFAITDPPMSGGAGGVRRGAVRDVFRRQVICAIDDVGECTFIGKRGSTGCTCWFGSFGEGNVHLREPRNCTTYPPLRGHKSPCDDPES